MLSGRIIILAKAVGKDLMSGIRGRVIMNHITMCEESLHTKIRQYSLCKGRRGVSLGYKFLS